MLGVPCADGGHRLPKSAAAPRRVGPGSAGATKWCRSGSGCQPIETARASNPGAAPARASWTTSREVRHGGVHALHRGHRVLVVSELGVVVVLDDEAVHLDVPSPNRAARRRRTAPRRWETGAPARRAPRGCRHGREVVDAESLVVHAHRVPLEPGAPAALRKPGPARVFHGQDGVPSASARHRRRTAAVPVVTTGHGRGRCAGSAAGTPRGGAQHRVPGGVGQPSVTVAAAGDGPQRASAQRRGGTPGGRAARARDRSGPVDCWRAVHRGRGARCPVPTAPGWRTRAAQVALRGELRVRLCHGPPGAAQFLGEHPAWWQCRAGLEAAGPDGSPQSPLEPLMESAGAYRAQVQQDIPCWIGL